MEDNSILLNGGHHLEVAVRPQAYPQLVRVLGGETNRQEILSLHVSSDDEGKERVAVSVGAEEIGYLPVDVDPGLLATIKACELHQAMPRARGSLQASWEEPGKVNVKVDLADPDDLLSDPDTRSVDSVCIEEPPVSIGAEALESAEAPILSAGYTEDYPDWPPPKPKPVMMDPAPFTERSSFTSLPDPARSSFGATTGASSDVTTGPIASDQALLPSPDTFLATRSAWSGGPTGQSAAPQAGWLGATAGATPHATTPSTQSSTPGPSTRAFGVSTEPIGQDPLAQVKTSPTSASANDLDSEIVAAWGSSGPTTQTVPEPLAPSKRRMNTSWVIPTVFAVLAIAVGLLVWKFVFAPKTYTDPDYGYSFSYPGRWEVIADSSMMSQFAYLMEGEQIPSMVLVGTGFDSDTPDKVAMLAVARVDLPSYADKSQIIGEMQSGLDEASAAGVSVSVIEPAYQTTIGGLEAWKMTMSVGMGFFSMTMSYCVLFDGSTSYILMAAATGDAWSDNRKAFDRFFDSFEPG